jgi:hypothetical protein
MTDTADYRKVVMVVVMSTEEAVALKATLDVEK